jgi:hypothetical protein
MPTNGPPKPSPIRRGRGVAQATKWMLTLGTLLFAAGFVLSLRYQVTVRHPDAWRVEICGGVARINWSMGPPSAAPGPTQFDAGTHSTPFEPWPRIYRCVGWPGFILPLWIVCLAFALPAATLWRGGRRPPHACETCG